MINSIYIPTFISSITYAPAKVSPHIYFYNGTKICQLYYVEHFDDTTATVVSTFSIEFPYFDNYSGNNPTTESKSLLFFNEDAVYGEAPTGSLYSEYWEKYVTLLYAPTTRLFNCQAIIPLADYFQMELNDIVEWRGNYYHLRAIVDYNLSNGECNLQLLGPILGDVIANILPGIPCNFDFSIESYTAPLECCAPTITTASLSGGNVLLSFTTGSECLECVGTTIEVSTDTLNWSLGNTGSCISPRSIAAPTSSIYYRMYTSCTGSVTSSVSNSYYYQSGSAPVEPYNYYNVDKYDCNLPTGPCSLNLASLIATTDNTISLINGNYYNIGDSYTYLVNYSVVSQSADVDLAGAASAGTNCYLTCLI